MGKHANLKNLGSFYATDYMDYAKKTRQPQKRGLPAGPGQDADGRQERIRHVPPPEVYEKQFAGIR